MTSEGETWRVHVTEKTPEESVVMFTQGVSVRSVAMVHHDVGVWLQEAAADHNNASALRRALTEAQAERVEAEKQIAALNVTLESVTEELAHVEADRDELRAALHTLTGAGATEAN